MQTFMNLCQQWMQYRERMAALGSVAGSTMHNQERIAAGLSRAFGTSLVSDLRKSHIDLYVAERLQTCKPVTVHAELAVLRQILNWAVDERIIKERPRLPTVKVPNTERPLPGDDDYIWYLRHLPEHQSHALEFMLLTGLAPHELARLQPRDIGDGGIVIGGRPDFRVKQESRRRVVPLNPRAALIWSQQSTGRAPDASVFPRENAMQRAMRRLFLSRDDAPAAADGLTPKMMRKWFASKVAAEHSEAVLQRLMGHAPGSPITRRHYVRSNDQALRDAVCLSL
jgi:integrase